MLHIIVLLKLMLYGSNYEVFAIIFAVDCNVTEWTTWSSCSVTCGGGMKSSTRKIISEPLFDGKLCPDSLDKEEECVKDPCIGDSLSLLALAHSNRRTCQLYKFYYNI